ncbi:MAG: hypothetical protein COA44_04130 [Arcobacter sp.]|nr:MAG: hypothetical protein COA44_04130 [Arcobacter sp.]
MFKNSFIPKIVILLMAWSTANALSLLRITCDDSSQGAKVYINGVHKGKCPRDIGLAAGDIRLRAVIKVDTDHERVFEKNIHLYDRSPERVEVQLSSSQLNTKAKKAKASATLAKAQAGDIKEMKNISKYYKEGMGLVQSSSKAEYWSNKASEMISQNKREKEQEIAKEVLSKAKAGDISAMDKISRFYAEGKGVKQDALESQKWKDKASSERALKKHTAEVKKAKEVLSSAEAGNISSMETISSFYQTGKGVEQSSTKSQEWLKRSELARAEKKQRAKEAKRRAEAQEELYNLNPFENTKAFIQSGKRDIDDNPFLSLGLTTGLPFMLLGDLTSSPTYTMKKKSLENELNARASSFENSNSMVAKAYNKSLKTKNIQSEILLSSRK